jgi:alanine racemase
MKTDILYTISQIIKVWGLEHSSLKNDSEIKHLSVDTRSIINGENTMFFALEGSISNGHDFIDKAIQKGVKNIVCNYIPKHLEDSSVNFIIVNNVLQYLQELVAWHRSQFDIETIGITGSNGKTIVKEWLVSLCNDHNVIASPKSYNSQVGVPLSVWPMNSEHNLGIFEAGISTVNEMSALAKIIQPTIGLFTNIGDAHDTGFASRVQKIEEKLDLFDHCQSIIYCSDHSQIHEAISNRFRDKKLLTWGSATHNNIFFIEDRRIVGSSAIINICIDNLKYEVKLPFVDKASIENAMHTLGCGIVLGYDVREFIQRMTMLDNVPMRLEMKYGPDGCLIINDTYTADLAALKIGLDFLEQQAGDRKRWLVLSDFAHMSDNGNFIKELVETIKPYNFTRITAIGRQLNDLKSHVGNHIQFENFLNYQDALSSIKREDIADTALLVKGARSFQLDKMVDQLVHRHHSTTLETDLEAVDQNLRYFSSLLHNSSKIVAVIKASAYGSGSEELARFLQYRKVATLAVAYADEGIYLRARGVTMPIMILNPDDAVVDDLLNYQLEPEVYDISQLEHLTKSIAKKSSGESLNIHIKIDSGMHRLGFMPSEITALCALLEGNKYVNVKSIFSHLSGSEDASLDEYTHKQASVFIENYEILCKVLNYRPLRHLLNSSGILRFKEYHYDWVRLGLGLYGIDSHGEYDDFLEKAHTLKAKVIQIKSLSLGDSVGYNRKGILKADSKIAIVNIGYADGLKRAVGNGAWSAMINGKQYPTIGNVCMDLTMFDIGLTSDVKVGDDVILFSKIKPIEEMAMACNTIPYEILTSIGTRVKRIYTHG